MSYEPTNWKTGDVVTSEKLNKMEGGIADAGGGFLKVTASYDDQTQVATMDKTWQEIYDAIANGKYVSIVSLDGLNPGELNADQARIFSAQYVAQLGGGGFYEVSVESTFENTSTSIEIMHIHFTCATANDYPSHKDEG